MSLAAHASHSPTHRACCSEIRRLWQVAGERYRAAPAEVALAIGPDYSVWSDLPEAPEQVLRQ